MAGVFTIPASADFAAVLADGVSARCGGDALAISSAIIYLPTRRAARGFGDAFARVMGGAALLPQFRALGESEEDEFLFDVLGDDVELAPAISPIRRQLLLANLVRHWKTAEGETLSFAQAASLGASLARVMDDVETQNADLKKLKEVIPAALAEHWQDVARFLDIIDAQWPNILAAEGRTNPAARQAAVLTALAARLKAHPPEGLMIAAGSTGSIPATRALLKTIAGQPNGAVVLPGLDLALDAESWNALDPGHPQYGLKVLLQDLGVERVDVQPWSDAPANAPREALLRETLRPAPTTDAWRALANNGKDELARGLDGLSQITAANPGEEALAIALALREALETPGRTAALITPDRGLARRVASEMRRWGVTIDDSAGRPLAHMAAGSFLCLLAEAVQEDFAPVPLLALLKHPFARAGQDAAAFRARARELDRWCLRGPRPDPGLDGIARAIEKAKDAYRPPPEDARLALAGWWSAVAAILKPLEELWARGEAVLADLLVAHVTAGELLACGDVHEGCLLWAGPDGEKAQTLCAELGEAAAELAAIEPSSYAPLFRSLAMGVSVRSGFGRHPRLAILGPLEARLQRFDLTILGGLNEGSWPQGAGNDPWFSRPMRAALGLEQPERGIGQAAHDFAGLAAQPQVLLTRSQKADGAPAIASRWLQRLDQLAAGLGIARPPATDYARLAARLSDVPQATRIAPPMPRPPVKTRPSRLSITEIETWLRDPYAIYAKHVLKLLPLEALDQPVGPLERGTALHLVLERFVRAYPNALPGDAVEKLAVIADQVFDEQGIPKAALAVWRPRFLGAARAIVAFEAARRDAIAASHLEIKGALEFPRAEGAFTLSGRADRIDILTNGAAAILDYKSGTPPSKKQVERLLSPQLPLEAAMLARGAFAEAGKRDTEEMLYLGLGDEKTASKPTTIRRHAAGQLFLLPPGHRIARFDDAPPSLAHHSLSHRHRRRLRPSGAGARMVGLRLGGRGMSRPPSVIASDPDISAWVAANAGSGKTYTLANRVARLLLAGANPARILCLTFTKAAAAEMQARLFAQLGKWAMLPDDDLRAHIVEIGGDAHAGLPRARQLFAGALETPGGLKILTLHAFCQIVLSRFPIEAGVPPGFDVLDEASAGALIGQARQHILERAGTGRDPMLAAAIALIVRETGEGRLTGILDAALGGDRRRLERFFAANRDIGAAVRKGHGLADGETMQSIADDFCAGVARDIETLREIHAWLSTGSTNDLKAAVRLETVLARLGDGGGFAALGDLLLTSAGEPRKSLATAKLAKARPDLSDWLNDLQARYCDTAEKRRNARAAELAHAALGVVDAVRRHFRAAKRLRGVLDYDDLVIETQKLLRRAGAAAWVLYKLDGGIDHVLIDEAQDTSPEQWDIVRSLTEEFFAGESERGPRTIFAVGDEKQSIFSFQGADPAQFEINRRHFTEISLGKLVNQPLETSRRSTPDILSFVDRVFESEAARAALTSSGTAIQHIAHRAEDKGGIEFWPPLSPDDSEEVDPWAPVDAVQAASPVARLAVQVAERIAGWLNSGARLPGHDNPIRPGDIMILMPRREPFGGEVIRQLKLRGVPVAGADRVRLSQQIAAMDLIALGRFVLQREDDLTLAALLRSPLCGLSEEDLFSLAHDRKSDLWRALVARRNDFPAAHDLLAAMLERADYAPPFEFYAHLLSGLGAREKLLARLGPESADAIDEFLSLTLTYERGFSPSLEGFLDWVERGGTEIKRDMERGRDEVRVMTVHGAKGLEADIVILPDTTSRPGGLRQHEGLLHANGVPVFPLPKQDAPQIVADAKAAADDETLNEHRRLLYVALTRARDRLFICGFTGKRGAIEDSWYGWMRQAAEGMGVPVTEGDSQFHAIGTLTHETGAMATPEHAPNAAALPGWAATAAPPEPATPNPIRPSEIGDNETGSGQPPATSPLGGARFARGVVVHDLLARLPDISREARAHRALNYAAARGFAGAAGEELVAETLAVLDHPDFAEVFGPHSRAEAAIHASRPDLGLKAPITGRIDRLAVMDDRVLIVDFKTNRPVPASADAVAPLYLDQMALYRAAAQAIFPGRRIDCGLVFTDGPRLLTLPPALLDARIAGLAARLAGAP
ncbi:MAG: double-strand break repair helicase AddA [Alphaproteobacteria bacterium]|nr:double-strand break repair helicase AddA [Alphaproteobacteria bacterium]